jgi:pyruvate formate-lyase activating enzyme-like uncharacterized protein
MESILLEFPQRKIKKSYRSVTGHFPSIKNNRFLSYESTLEARFFLSLEFDDEVQDYMEQPQFKIHHKGRFKIHSSDCYVRYIETVAKKNTIVEVKYVSEIQKDPEEFELKRKNVEEAVEKMDKRYMIFTDETLPETYLNNLDFLYRYKTHRHRNKKQEEKIIDAIENSLSVLEIVDSIAKDKTDYFQLSNVVFSMIANGVLRADLDKETLSMNSLVWRNDERR